MPVEDNTEDVLKAVDREINKHLKLTTLLIKHKAKQHPHNKTNYCLQKGIYWYTSYHRYEQHF